MKLSFHFNRQTRLAWGVLVVTLLLSTLSPSIFAQRERHPVQQHHDRRVAQPHWQGNIARFHERDWHTWRGGQWTHSRHDGRIGWWWVVGSSWYFYPTPVYPYPSPWEPAPVVVVPPVETIPMLPPPPTQYWYYCEASRSYYPYVSTCADGWKQVPATPSDVSPAPQR
jgi:hypothetical protein